MLAVIAAVLAFFFASAMAPIVVTDLVDSSGNTVRGSLALPDGTTIQAYPVIISGKDVAGNPREFSTKTDRDGRFKLEGLPAGHYTGAPANLPGASESFKIAEEHVTILDFLFGRTKTLEMDIGEIKVTSGEMQRSASE